MSEKSISMHEYIRRRPQMFVAVYPARTLFQWLLAEFTDLHLAGRTNKIQVECSRESLTIRSFGGGFEFSSLRSLPAPPRPGIGEQQQRIFKTIRGCSGMWIMEIVLLVAAAFSRKFRVSTVYGGRKIICTSDDRHKPVCRELKSDATPGSELAMELDKDFLNAFFSPVDTAGFELEYVKLLLLEKCALYPKCEFILNGSALPRSSGLAEMLFHTAWDTEYRMHLGSALCCGDALEIALGYDRFRFGDQQKAKERLFFVNGHRTYDNGRHWAFQNDCSTLLGEVWLRGFETALRQVMMKLRGAEDAADGIHAVLHLQLGGESEEPDSSDTLYMKVSSDVYWKLLHALFPFDAGDRFTICFKGSEQPFAEFQKSIWRRLEPLDKESLLLTHPELFALLDDPQEELAPDRWLGVLACQPQFEKYFDWSTVENRPSNEWDFLLRRQPQFADHCDFSQLRSDQIRRILDKQPQFIDRCDWSQLNPKDREKLEAKGIKP